MTSNSRVKRYNDNQTKKRSRDSDKAMGSESLVGDPRTQGSPGEPALGHEPTDFDAFQPGTRATSKKEEAQTNTRPPKLNLGIRAQPLRKPKLHGAERQRVSIQQPKELSEAEKRAIASKAVSSTLTRIAQDTLVVAGVSTVTMLAIGGLAPLLIPTTSTLATNTAFNWLTSIGSNVLANWIQTWAEKQTNKLFTSDPTQELAQHMGPDLEADMRKNRSLASALANMLEKLDIRGIIVDAINKGLEVRDNLVTRLKNDLQVQREENSELLSITSYLVEQLNEARAQQAQLSNAPSVLPNTPSSQTPGPRAPPAEAEVLKNLLQDPLN